MKRLLLVPLAVALLCILAGSALAVPTLQLEIAGGVYDPVTLTTVATTDPFTLYAYLIPDKDTDLTSTFALSVAVVPSLAEQSPPPDLGSFTLNGGSPIEVTADMSYGTPPLQLILPSDGNLAEHGVFDTYFSEFQFSFVSTQYGAVYDVQTAPYDSPQPYVPGDNPEKPEPMMYYLAFTFDTSLASGYALHFDLYDINILDDGIVEQSEFAPFSHDGESGPPVPEPGTILLLGSGLLGLGAWRRRKKTF